MPFADPAGGFFSPNMPSGGPVDIPRLPLQPLPDTQNIGSPRSQPFELVRPVSYEADKTAGIALRGTAEALGNAVEGIDNAVKISAVNEVRKELGALFNKQIQAGLEEKQELLSERTDNQDRLANTPVGLSQGLGRLSALEKAARSGPISDSGLQARASEIIAGLKTRYPGYGHVIEDAGERLFGVSAEKQRSAVQKDIDAIRKAQVDRIDQREKFLLSNINDLPSDWRDRSYLENEKIIHSKQVARQKYKDDELKIKAEAEAGILPWQKAGNSLSWQGTLKSSEMINEVTRALEKKGYKLEDITAGRIDPTELQFVVTSLGSMNDAYKRHMSLAATTQSFDSTNPGLTPYNIMRNANKGDEVDKIIQQSNNIERLLTAITNKEWGAVGSIARELKSIETAREAEIMKNNPEILDHSILNQRLGPTYAAVASVNTKLQGSIANAVSQLGKRRMLSTGFFSDKLRSIQEQHKNEYGMDLSSGAVNEYISDATTVLAAQDIPDKQYHAQFFKSVYLDPNNTYLLTGIAKSGGGINDAISVYNRFISPEITQNVIKRMPEDIKQGYTAWAENNFAKLAPRLGEDINSMVTKNPYYNVVYDEATSKFVTVATQAGKDRPDLYAQAIGMHGKAVPSNLDKLNTSLGLLKPIIEASGRDFNEYVKTLPYLQPSDMKKEDSFLNKRQQHLDRKGYGKTASDVEVAPVLNLIRRGEASGGYDIMFGDSNFKATSMTVGEVLSEQQKRIAGGAKSVAVGGYQFINETLKGLVKDMKIDMNEQFSPQLQDRLATELLNRRGYQDYKAGKLPKSKLIDNLSKEWAALPNMSGKGSYDGDGLNKANVTLAELIDIL
jgi:muramidase (phage lysozyme)